MLRFQNEHLYLGYAKLKATAILGPMAIFVRLQVNLFVELG